MKTTPSIFVLLLFSCILNCLVLEAFKSSLFCITYITSVVSHLVRYQHHNYRHHAGNECCQPPSPPWVDKICMRDQKRRVSLTLILPGSFIWTASSPGASHQDWWRITTWHPTNTILYIVVHCEAKRKLPIYNISRARQHTWDPKKYRE